MTETSSTGVRLLALVIGFWLIMRSINSDSSGRTLIDRLLGNKASKSPYLSASLPATPSPANTPNAGGYVSPFAQAQGFTLGREDMGIDANMKPGSPILAPADSTFLGSIANWFKGQPYLAFQMPNGQNYYLAEQITPIAGLTPGKTVPAGQPIAYYAPTGTGIEMGWAGGGNQPGSWQQTLAQAKGAAGEANPAAGSSTVYGGSFLAWLRSQFGQALAAGTATAPNLPGAS